MISMTITMSRRVRTCILIYGIGRMNVRNHKGSVFTDNVYLVDMHPQMDDMVDLYPS